MGAFQEIFVGAEIPGEFAGGMNCKTAILMGPSCNLWHVNVKFGSTGAAAFTDGWQAFVSDNRIRATDILVFRHARDIDFVVQVFGAIPRENEHDHPQQEICSQNKEIEIVLVDSSTSTSSALPNVESPSFMRDNSVVNPGKSTEAMFSLTLTKSATSQNFHLTIPRDFGERWLPKKRVEARFVHHKNPGEWRHMVGVFNKGKTYGVRWKEFAIDNKLRKGDKCVFKLINAVNHIFMVYVNTQDL
ncbi:B3 domain-containing protein REM9-like [Cryptomeria japonica]|uniref:B3 domain-containing protein REM9-like n=1 Tax=Cryptomeria japonica TaxID=3369 RepID=UPI0027DA4872|nr:B3 domain-containing protein REM9-like [Cryptomeria japonica]